MIGVTVSGWRHQARYEAAKPRNAGFAYPHDETAKLHTEIGTKSPVQGLFSSGVEGVEKRVETKRLVAQ